MTVPQAKLDDPRFEAWHQGVPYAIARPGRRGVAVVVALALGFGGWGLLAPLDGAVIASGSFVASGQNKEIQHLEGGIVRDLLVSEGDVVERDQVIVRLDDTAAKAKLRRLMVRRYRLLALQARLEAQIDNTQLADLPAVLANERKDAAVIGPIFERQQMELKVRRVKQADEEEILRREIAGLRESMTGYDAQVQSLEQRIGLFGDELKDKKSLLDRQLARRTDVMALQRAEAGLAGQRGELMGRIADARERMARAEQQISQLRSAALQAAVEEMRKTEAELDDVTEQITAGRDVLERVEVRAPERAVVVKLHYNARGAVVAPGAAILELVPEGNLIIEARVRPNDISNVHAGQSAFVRLSALNQRLTPVVAGNVSYVSADTVPEPASAQHAVAQGGQPSFVVRVKLDETDVRAKVPGFTPTPGMPADVYIKTGERTFFEYMMRPVFDSFSRSFREH
jgi:HlyD family type I secretion membrane fusion protein